MKKSILSGFFLAWVVAQAAAVPETYQIDPVHSFMRFEDRFLWLGSIDGCFCGGISGILSFDPAAPETSTVEFEVKTDTVDTGSAERNNEIKSPDFLNVKQFPLITFKSKSVHKVNNQQYNVTGDLTFHGVTKPLTIHANLISQGKSPNREIRAGADIQLAIKRSEFGIKYGLPALADEVYLTIGIRK